MSSLHCSSNVTPFDPESIFWISGSDKNCSAYISGMYDFRKTAELLRDLPLDFFWNLCKELEVSYNSYVTEMFMLYFMRMKQWLRVLTERLDDEDPWDYSIVIKDL